MNVYLLSVVSPTPRPNTSCYDTVLTVLALHYSDLMAVDIYLGLLTNRVDTGTRYNVHLIHFILFLFWRLLNKSTRCQHR